MMYSWAIFLFCLLAFISLLGGPFDRPRRVAFAVIGGALLLIALLALLGVFRG